MTSSDGGEGESKTEKISLKPDKISVAHIIVNIFLIILQHGKMGSLKESFKTSVYFLLL